MPILLLIAVILSALAPTSHLTAQGVSLQILSPTQGATIYGNTIIVRLDTPGLTLTPGTVRLDSKGYPEANRPGQGHVQLMLDLQPLVAWDKTEPYVLLNVTPGDHVLTVEIVQNDASPFVPPLIEQIRFTAISSSPPVLELPSAFLGADANTSNTSVPRYTFAAFGNIFVITGGSLRDGISPSTSSKQGPNQ